MANYPMQQDGWVDGRRQQLLILTAACYQNQNPAKYQPAARSDESNRTVE